ncbi:hypothetical protein GCM10020331_096220 [Ectobacillus funiculus]
MKCGYYLRCCKKTAGVSIATVSKVLNNTGRISEKTRKKVLCVVKNLDYQPNIMASALMGKQRQLAY